MQKQKLRIAQPHYQSRGASPGPQKDGRDRRAGVASGEGGSQGREPNWENSEPCSNHRKKRPKKEKSKLWTSIDGMVPLRMIL